MRQLNDFIQLLGLFLIVLNAILYLKSYIFNKRSVTLLYLTLYLFICAVIMIISSYLGYKGDSNLHYSHLYFISQFIFLSLFYKSIFKTNQRKWVTTVLIIILLVLTIQYINKPELINKFNLFEIFVTSFPLIIYSGMHLYNSLSKKGEFMIFNSGVLIYITTSTLIFILGNYLSGFFNDTIRSIWLLNKVLYVIFLLLILIEWKKTILRVKSKS